MPINKKESKAKDIGDDTLNKELEGGNTDYNFLDDEFYSIMPTEEDTHENSLHVVDETVTEHCNAIEDNHYECHVSGDASPYQARLKRGFFGSFHKQDGARAAAVDVLNEKFQEVAGLAEGYVQRLHEQRGDPPILNILERLAKQIRESNAEAIAAREYEVDYRNEIFEEAEEFNFNLQLAPMMERPGRFADEEQLVQEREEPVNFVDEVQLEQEVVQDNPLQPENGPFEPQVNEAVNIQREDIVNEPEDGPYDLQNDEAVEEEQPHHRPRNRR